MELNDISGEIIGAAMRVHSALGPGLLESAYEVCLKYELEKRGIHGYSRRSGCRLFTTTLRLTLAIV